MLLQDGEDLLKEIELLIAVLPRKRVLDLAPVRAFAPRQTRWLLLMVLATIDLRRFLPILPSGYLTNLKELYRPETLSPHCPVQHRTLFVTTRRFNYGIPKTFCPT